jgi:hypothetical protein
MEGSPYFDNQPKRSLESVTLSEVKENTYEKDSPVVNPLSAHLWGVRL